MSKCFRNIMARTNWFFLKKLWWYLHIRLTRRLDCCSVCLPNSLGIPLYYINLSKTSFPIWLNGHSVRRIWRYQSVIRIRKSMKDRQHDGQRKKDYLKDKQRSTKHTHTTKDRVTRTPLKTGSELRCFGRVFSISCCQYICCIEYKSCFKWW